MSELSRQARRAMRAKIHRITKGSSGNVDASDYGPEEVLNANVKTGMRPISRRAYKKGGKVVANEGKEPVKHAGKKPRNGPKHLTVDALVNRNYKDANEDREGIKHVGALKRGGRAKKEGGGPLSAMGGDLYGLQNVPVKSRAAMAAGLKKGGRANKQLGGGLDRLPSTPTAERDSMSAREMELLRKSAAADAQKPIVPGRTSSLPTPAPKPKPRKHGGKAWEGSAKDEAQDKKLAKKYGMSMSEWEKSDKDKKHDKQHSTKGLKSGGRSGKSLGGDIALGALSPTALALSKLGKRGEEKNRGGLAMDGEYQGTRPKGGRIAKRDGGSLAGLEMNKGGRAKKSGKTNINIVIATGRGDKFADQAGAPMPGRPPQGVPVPVPPPGAPGGMPPMPAGGPPPMPMPPMGPPAGGPPMPRKAGGRTYRSYKDMDAGAGSGLGRLEKSEIQKYKK